MNLKSIEAMAKMASIRGAKLRLFEDGNGWAWEWAHQSGGNTLVFAHGKTDAATKAVAFVFALEQLYGP